MSSRSISEKSFGQRLLMAQNMTRYIAQFVNYTPPRTQETAAQMLALTNNIISANNTESVKRQGYNTAVTNRIQAVKLAPTSVQKVLTRIANAIKAQYGTESTEYEQVRNRIANMRAQKLRNILAREGAAIAETQVSVSEQSYGSITAYFADLVQVISQFSGYNPGSSLLTLANLQAQVANVQLLNTRVADNLSAMKTAKASRRALYEELADRMLRIKNYVRAAYGLNSNEYRLIKSC